MGKQGMKRKKKNQPQRFTPVETTQEEPHEPIWAGEEAGERSRQTALAARERATRTQLSVGQTKVQRLHKGNQPRGH